MRAMEQAVHSSGLIDNKRFAIAAFCLTTFLMLINFRHGIAHPKNGSYWLFDTRMFLPTRVAITLNLFFYAYLLLTGMSIYWAARGQERLIVISWFAVIFLGPVQHLFSISPVVVGYLDFAAVMTAFLASAYILVKFSTGAAARQSQE
jgi:hypothetical protein